MNSSLSTFNTATMIKILIILFLLAVALAVLLGNLRDSLDPNITVDVPIIRPYRNSDIWPTVGNHPENIFWIVQLSDIHISKFRDLKRGPDLVHFCKDYLSVIQPHIILVSGDLTDAKDADDKKSSQFIDEWKVYQKAIQECRTYTNATFLDTRGNHDAFNVPDVDGDGNLYRKYSVSGHLHALSYRYEHITPFGRYSFIAVDACPVPGPKRPFNFFGHLDEGRVQQLIDLSMESRDSNLTLWFGHYPTSLIVQDPPGIRHIMRNGVAYLCGHLHTLGEILPEMYTRQKTGTLELELGDWKIYRTFRVLAIDHDLLSFVDGRLGDWPIVLITNPKHNLFLTPRHEPIELIGTSSHIRLLIFHHQPLTSVEIYIDSVFIGVAVQSKGPLYTLQWNPDSYNLGQHDLRVIVKDVSGLIKTIEQPFSVDGTQSQFSFMSRFILMMNILSLGKLAFGCLVFAYVLLLASLRQFTVVRNLYFSGNNFFVGLINSWLLRLWLVAKTDTVYKILLGFILYITFGPWFVGDLMTEYKGVVFIWGIFLKGSFLPGDLNYFYGIFQLMTFNIPLLLIMGATLDWRRHQVSSQHVLKRQKMAQRILLADLPFIFILVFQAYMALTEFPINYGTTAMVLSPVRVGSLIVGVVVMYYGHHAPVKRICAVNGEADK